MRHQSDKTRDIIAWTRLTLAMLYPKGAKYSDLARIVGLMPKDYMSTILPSMDDVWQEGPEIGLTDIAAEKYEDILERKFA
jgi:hypothetical protein